MDLAIAPLEEKDVLKLARILKAVADEEVLIATPPGVSLATAEAMLRASLARAAAGGGVELVARVKGKILGGASIERGGPRQEHVADLYLFLAEESRGKGVGGKLLEALEKEAPELGITKLSVTVLAGNLNARHLFESRGYEQEGIRRRNRNLGLFEEDEVLLAKFLPR